MGESGDCAGKRRKLSTFLRGAGDAHAEGTSGEAPVGVDERPENVTPQENAPAGREE